MSVSFVTATESVSRPPQKWARHVCEAKLFAGVLIDDSRDLLAEANKTDPQALPLNADGDSVWRWLVFFALTEIGGAAIGAFAAGASKISLAGGVTSAAIGVAATAGLLTAISMLARRGGTSE